MNQIALTEREKQLLTHYQRGFPRTSRPFRTIARELSCSEDDVLNSFRRLQEAGVISRLGPVFNHRKAGTSTLAAISVPDRELENVAALINSYPEVNHNYQREHTFNLWFVITAPDVSLLDEVIQDIEKKTGHPVLRLPMVKPYHIDLGFKPDFD
ncbi:Lrp/AsnC family transcriptional regulator [Hahella ganghwensis]|uniref:Lrp/AsnC family transcriptional regulator n=1 Tax=Hahella ganghwensis TaxID=286420 RepID=UPI00037B7E47|nr:Lrp/AsnC family transcriptional regulator [Hahella ganghwensis]